MRGLIETLRAHITALLPAHSRIVVAVSGGPDSQALLDLLAELRDIGNWRALWAVGVDHGLRQAAAAELHLASSLAARHGIPYCTLKVTLAASGNTLNNARRARYRALEAFASQHGATHIALAHHANDQAETILQNLARGSALKGAGGMRPRRGMLVRPLLQTSRADIERYIHARAIPHAHDPSNQDTRRARTLLRQTVVPTLQTLNSRWAEHMAQFAACAQEDEAYLERLATQRLARCSAASSLPQALIRGAVKPVATRMLRLWLARNGLRSIDHCVLDALWHQRSTACRAMSVGSATIRVERGCYWLTSASRAPAEYDLPLQIPGKTALYQYPRAVIARISQARDDVATQITHWDAESVAFDADHLHFGLRLRSWRAGDSLQPFGLDGHIKVGDLFTNAKVPRALRASWPVITHDQKIVWVVGLRRGSDAPISARTRRIITLKLDEALLGSAC